ncbi:PREDICTED: protein EXORDIUM-like 4 [Lupinus angustifolius]|uniref:protein EXORDIUM-like 4 n=1 Tax=Lupinus angustifolius TaxID=3871 RepID=UPI00092F2F59|nr:PREDICTED: protein EXORDIUM-like 4 [Lupinus angustifolius]
MASNSSNISIIFLSFALSLLILFPVALSDEVTPPITNHRGHTLAGQLNIGILWYGPITNVQRKSILSFFRSLNTNAGPQPQVSSWWKVVESYGGGRIPVKVVNQVSDPNYSLGKVLIKDFIKMLLPKATAGKSNTVAVIIATKGVTVQDMCAGSCAQHGLIENQVYVAVGDPEEECPECAWPFLKTPGKPGPVVRPPSGDVGADAMVKLLAGGLAGVVTNPFGDGFYSTARGDVTVEASTKCPDTFAAVNGEKLSKFVLPAIWNPATSTCWTR